MSLTGKTARLGFALVYLMPLLVLSYTQSSIGRFCLAYPITAHVLAMILLAASFGWIRHELATRMVGQKTQPSAYAMSS